MQKMTRHVMTVTDDMARRIQTQKKEKYFDKPFTALYREIIKRGLDELEKETRTSKAR